MENSKGSSNIRSLMYSGKHALLPPKSPFPIVSPSYADYASNSVIGSKSVQKPRQHNMHHQRTSSETLLIDEHPSWLDDLLNEPETPVLRVHRRSSSDSFAYVDVANTSNMVYVGSDRYRHKHVMSTPFCGSQEFDHHKDFRQNAIYTETNMVKQKNRSWDSPLNTTHHASRLLPTRDNSVSPNLGSACVSQESDGVPSSASEKKDQSESGAYDLETATEKKDGSHSKSSASETDTKRAKQQFAQRSRVRKLQYISELERNVQALQAEESEVSAELEFLNHQNLILSMENKTLKQRLESLTQEQLIKRLEHEVLEREIGRLRAVFQQQHQKQQLSYGHHRTYSRDLDSQFANRSLKHKDANSGSEPVSGPLRL
ncbi:hypothetical protein K2173_022234 [Erythroxylum novogranatense]|uniref:BZIP domain-containing protein n=1 Tax=Erythroxylum novogranatense TaxID=1862640 RepID=A0AAV8SUW1_9ROSI|nr:hypothetical protein K2173_022234 [Erythroxylum novogranatense]